MVTEVLRDEIHALFARLPPGCYLTVILDPWTDRFVWTLASPLKLINPIDSIDLRANDVMLQV